MTSDHLKDVTDQMKIGLGTILGTMAILLRKGITQVVEKKMVGDTGFEPVTSTV